MRRSPRLDSAAGVAHGNPVPGEADATVPSLDSPSLFCNREMSLLAFQLRVLEEARDEANPLIERLNFLSILSSNLSEFFMVRVAVLKQSLAASVDGRTGQEQLDAIAAEVTRIENSAYRSLSEDLLPALAQSGVHIVDYGSLESRDRAVADAYFHDTVFPVLTPLAVDPARPFPHISNLSLNLGVLVRGPDGVEHFARLGEFSHSRIQEPQGVLEVKHLGVVGAEGASGRVAGGKHNF